MCQLVTIGVPRSVGAALTEFGGPRDGFAITPSCNPHVASIFPATDLRLEVTAGGCSCGLVGFHHDAGDQSRQRRRYEREGWSRSKIDRALQASAVAHERAPQSANERRFREGVLALLRRIPSIRLFIHMYSGAYDTEVVVSKGAARVSRVEYEAAHGVFPADTLVEVLAG